MRGESMEVRFWDKVDKTGDCWLWRGAKSRSGYGAIWDKSGQVSAHRYAYMLAYGSVPPGQMVCHTCDVRLCVNPAHLFLGTTEDNMRDMVEKGRASRGGRNPHAKLTEEQAAHILASPVATSELARQFGMSFQGIWQIRAGKNWKHLSADGRSWGGE